MKAHLGISPIAWWNDDLVELSADISLEDCLREAREAGYTGMEAGQRFPKEAAVLGPVLADAGIKLCGGWFSGLLVDNDVESEKERIAEQLALFKAMEAPCIVYGETAGTIQGDRSAPLATKRRIGEEDMRAYGRRLTALAEWCADQGMPLSFHHHMGTVVETEPELDALMNHTGEALGLLYDAGHKAFARGDVLQVIDKHHKRINHVHTKDVRHSVIEALDRSRESFLDAVVKGAFTVPGDGSLDFGAIVQRLADYGYEGWFVVEAEQDPKMNNPLRMAKTGRAELVRVAEAAGYEVVI